MNASSSTGALTGLGGIVKRAVSWCAPWAVVVRGPSSPARQAAMTFDDGPHPENTPRILDLLDTHGARATFFLQGSMVDRHPHIARQIVRRGHQIGNHGYAHLDARAVGIREYLADVLRAQAAIEAALGDVLPRNFRPPFGNITPRTMLALLRHRFRLIFWSLDSRDSFIEDAPALVNHVAQQRVEAGCIMLFHDDYRRTVDAIEEILGLVQRQGVTLVTLDTLLSRTAFSKDIGTRSI